MRHFVAVLVFVVITPLFAGCANHGKSKYLALPQREAQALVGRTVTIEVDEPARFRHLSGGAKGAMMAGAMFGIVGALTSASIVENQARNRGDAIVAKHRLVEPTAEMARRVEALLRERYDAQPGPDGLPVRIATPLWTLDVDALVYTATLEIGFAKGKYSLGRGQCLYRTPQIDTRALDVVLADDARFLKEETARALASCVAAFDAHVLTRPQRTAD